MGVVTALGSPDHLLAQIGVGVGGQRLIAEADSQAVLDHPVEGGRRGDVGQLVRLEGEAVDHGVADSRRFIVQDFAQTLAGPDFGVLRIDVLEEDDDEASGEQRRADVGDRQAANQAQPVRAAAHCAKSRSATPSTVLMVARSVSLVW